MKTDSKKAFFPVSYLLLNFPIHYVMVKLEPPRKCASRAYRA